MKNMTIEQYVEMRKKQNKGHYSQLIGDNGFRIDLTVDLFNKLKAEAEERFDKGQLKSSTTSSLKK